MFARSQRIVDRMEQALGGEVYLYHMKMMLKEPQGRRRLGNGIRITAIGITTAACCRCWRAA